MNFPTGFEDQLAFLGESEMKEFKAAMAELPITSLRVNPAKWKHDVHLPKVPWADHGHYLEERPSFTCDPLIHAGAYYVQEASSMVIGFILKFILPELPDHALLLDLCAAPGGKSTDLATGIREGDLLLSNEVIQSRARTLKENVIKWGSPAHWVSNNDPEDFKALPGLFNLVLIDAPCSGEGLFRKDASAIEEWSPEAVNHCQKRQKRILADAWDCIGEEGYLVYATCTYNTSENEEVLEWLIEQHEVAPVTLAVEPFGFQCFERKGFPIYKAFPGKINGEGFSFFVVKKRERVAQITPKLKRKKDHRKRASVDTFVQDPLTEGLLVDEALFYTEHLLLRDWLADRLNLIRSGLRIGEFKKNKLIPDHELAVSQIINPKYPAIDLSYDQAVQYLKKEPFDLSTSDKGFQLVRYRSVNLGFINHLGNRFNSLLPASLRIHSQKCQSGDPQII